MYYYIIALKKDFPLFFLYLYIYTQNIEFSIQ